MTEKKFPRVTNDTIECSVCDRLAANPVLSDYESEVDGLKVKGVKTYMCGWCEHSWLPVREDHRIDVTLARKRGFNDAIFVLSKSAFQDAAAFLTKFRNELENDK